MKENTQIIAGNLAETATITSVSDTTDALNLRVITNEEWIDSSGEKQSKSCGHNVVQYGKKGMFDKFVEKSLQKGMPVYAKGTTEKKMNDGYLNVTINTTFDGGKIEKLSSSTRLNKQIIGGHLADDAIVRPANEGRDCLSFTVITDDSYFKDGKEVKRSCAHNVVQFGKTGQYDKLVELLKKGAGVYVEGHTEKENRKQEDKTYLNVTVNASFNNILIHHYVTEKAA